MREQPVACILVPCRDLRLRHRCEHRHPLPDAFRKARYHVHRRARHQTSPVTAPRETRVQEHPHGLRPLQLTQLLVQQLDGIPLCLSRVRRHVHRQQRRRPLLRRHPVTRIVNNDVRPALRAEHIQPRLDIVHRCRPMPQHVLHLRARRVLQMDDVCRIVAEHLHHVTLECLRVPVRIIHWWNVLVPVHTVPDDDGYAVRITYLRPRRPFSMQFPRRRQNGYQCQNDAP